MHSTKIIARGSFETLIDRLCARLKESGFHVLGRMVVPQDQSIGAGTCLRYNVVLVDHPRLFLRMLAASPADGLILPGCITAREVNPGETEMLLVNPTELLALFCNVPMLFPMASEATKLLEQVLQGFASDPSWTPDLITSWG